MLYDYAIIGGGIVGVASAMQMLRARPSASLVLLEKEDGLARHQTGHNSGVIHAGIYYQLGSLKAQFCKEGAEATIHFCEEHDIAFERCGTLWLQSDRMNYHVLPRFMNDAARTA